MEHIVNLGNISNTIIKEIQQKQVYFEEQIKKDIPEEIFLAPEEKTNINKDENTKYFYNKNYLALIKWDSFNKEKLSFNYFQTQNNMMIISLYNYSNNCIDRMILETPFMNITKEFLHHNQYIKYVKPEMIDNNLFLDPSQLNESLINIFITYDILIKHYIQKNYGDSIKCISKLISNKKYIKGTADYENVNLMCDLNPIKMKIKRDTKNKEYCKIFNYNISKKYVKQESFDINTLSKEQINEILCRLLNEKKQIRFLITPVSWINKSLN